MIFSRVNKGIMEKNEHIDAFGFWEDMAYNHAPLISPEMVRRFMLPRYRRVAEFLRGRGVPYIGLDSDGQIDCLKLAGLADQSAKTGIL